MKQFELQFPLGGLNRRYAHQRQPPFTSPSMMNVVPDDQDEYRARGGSRPGLQIEFEVSSGTKKPIRMLDSVTIVESNGLQTWSAVFSGGIVDNQQWRGGYLSEES